MTIPTNGISIACFAALLLGACFSPQAWSASSTITIRVNVQASPCEINHGETISVNFGDDLLTTLIDGSEYTKNVDYTLDCSQGASDALKIKIAGAASHFDAAVLQTSQQDLGIALSSDSRPLPLNQWINFDRRSPPVLTAVPVKSPGAHLKGGAFTAGATMMIDYQ